MASTSFAIRVYIGAILGITMGTLKPNDAERDQLDASIESINNVATHLVQVYLNVAMSDDVPASIKKNSLWLINDAKQLTNAIVTIERTME